MIYQNTAKDFELKKIKLRRIGLRIGICLIAFMHYFLYSEGRIAAIKGGKIQTVTNGIIENGIILVKDGLIIDIGTSIDIPSQADVYNFQNKFIVPGVVSPDSYLGIYSPPVSDAAPYQIRIAEPPGKNFAHYPVIFSFYPENPVYKVALNNGFTTLALSPPPEGISGLGAIIQPISNNFRECIIKEKAFLKINFYVNTPFWDMLKKAFEEAQIKISEIKKIREEEIKKGKTRFKNKDELKQNESTNIFMEVLEGKLPLLAECREPDSISHLLELISDYPQVKLIVHGGPFSYKAGALLKKNNIPIILEPKISIKQDFFMPYPERINNILKCEALGLRIAIQAPGEINEQVYLFDMLNCLYELGVDKETLLKGITIIPATLLGIDNLIGSLEKGKKADLLVFKDDPLENPPVLENVILGGKIVK